MQTSTTPTLFSVPSSPYGAGESEPSRSERRSLNERDTAPQSGPSFHVPDDIDSAAVPPQGALAAWLERFARNWGRPHLQRLAARKGRVSSSMRDIPAKMHRVALQSELMLELIDDFKTGRYRKVPWRSVAIVTAALLYSVNPADVVPDALPIVGGIDDLYLIGFASRLIRADLRDYCAYKGYDVARYFGDDSA